MVVAVERARVTMERVEAEVVGRVDSEEAQREAVDAAATPVVATAVGQRVATWAQAAVETDLGRLATVVAVETAQAIAARAEEAAMALAGSEGEVGGEWHWVRRSGRRSA